LLRESADASSSEPTNVELRQLPSSRPPLVLLVPHRQRKDTAVELYPVSDWLSLTAGGVPGDVTPSGAMFWLSDHVERAVSKRANGRYVNENAKSIPVTL
jgi:hypothetical protein